MKTVSVLLFNILFVSSLLLGAFSFAEAGSYQACYDLNSNKISCESGEAFTATYKGIVPCGKCVGISGAAWPVNDLTKLQCGNPPNPPEDRYLDCQLCHVFVMTDDILDTIMWRIVPSLGILFFLVAGFFYMASGDDPMKRKKANDVMKSTVIGILLIYGAWIIVNTIFNFTPLINMSFLDNPGKPWNWFTINCPISY